MENRIDMLIAQAQDGVWGNNPFNGSPEFEGYTLDAKKFAKLIIEECIALMSEAARQAEKNNTYMGEDVPTFAHQCNIKKHFRVE